MNYEKLTAGTTKTAIDTAKPSEKGEIITYLSRMGDVLDDIAEGSKLIVALGAVHPIVYGNKVNIMLREHDLGIHTHLQIITAKTGHIFLCQVGTKKIFENLQAVHRRTTTRERLACELNS